MLVWCGFTAEQSEAGVTIEQKRIVKTVVATDGFLRTYVLIGLTSQ